MRKVFAFLTEPASYTVDRNLKIYNPLGVDYCYMHGDSDAKNSIEEGNITILQNLSVRQRLSYMHKVLIKYDIIIFNGYTGILFLTLFTLNLWYRKALGIDSDTQYREPESAIKKWIKRKYLNFIFGKKHVYGLAGGNYTHKELFLNYGMDKSRVLLMPMMVNNEIFYNENFKTKPTDVFRFLYVGRLIKCKNIEFMIQAFNQFHQLYPNSELHIVGKGEMGEYLRNKYVSSKTVFFDGAKYGQELLQVYKDSHVLILPSTYEPWGLVVNEAMCGGLPVLVSEEVGARYDLVDGYETGLVFKSNNEQNLVDAMEKISQETVYKQYSVNAYKRMHEFWNYDLYEKCLNDFLSIYN